MRKRILTGDRPTGKLHLGHYVGSLMNRVKLQDEYETFILVADIQALTTHWEQPEMLRQAVLDVTMDNLAVGLDPRKVTFCIQSYIPQIAELTVIYGLFTNMNKLRHNPTTKAEALQYGYLAGSEDDEAKMRELEAKLNSLKESVEEFNHVGAIRLLELQEISKHEDVEIGIALSCEEEDELKRLELAKAHYSTLELAVDALLSIPSFARPALAQERFDQLTYGFFGYPVSQAADITFVRADAVPVGEDQVPHIELTRDIVRKFNKLYGGGKEIIPEPKAIVGEVARLRALDGDAKMSKSLGNAIYLSDDEKAVADAVRKGVTDPEKIRKNDPGHPDICNIFAYHKVFQEKLNLQPEAVAEIERDCKSGALGCVECKARLTKVLNELLAPIRERRKPYEDNPQLVWDILQEGTARARGEGDKTLGMVKAAMKIDYQVK